MMTRQAARWTQLSRTSDQEPKSIRSTASGIQLMQTYHRQYGPPQIIDLKFLATRPQIAFILADTFWIEMASMTDLTRRNRMAHLKKFTAYLDCKAKRGILVANLGDITFQLLGSFGKWLVHEGSLTETSAIAVYRNVTQHLRAARRLHPEKFKPDFEIPFHGLSQQGRGSDALDQNVFAEIIRAAETGASRIQDTYTPGDFPRQGCDLIPFMILIGAYTAINAFSLYGLRRDCLEPHPIDDHSIYVKWKKARSSKGTQRQLHLKRTSRTISLINFVLDYTRPVVEKAAASQRDFLFLYQASHCKNPEIVRIVTMGHSNNYVHSLRAFRERDNLPHFTFAQIRPTAATQNHLKNGGNLRKTQLLLGHKDIATTSLYIDKKILKPHYDTSIRAAQEAMVNRITVIARAATEAISELPEEISHKQRKRILEGEYSTGFGRCIDPRNSPQPGQRKGHTCTLFFACLSCPNSLYFLEDLPRVITLANHLRSLRQSMTQDAWDAVYGEHVRILEDEIIGAFSEKEIAAAALKATADKEMQLLMTNAI